MHLIEAVNSTAGPEVADSDCEFVIVDGVEWRIEISTHGKWVVGTVGVA